MGWNGSGVYSRLYNWVNDRDADIPITASRMDGEMNDMATGIQACVAKNGENTATANLPMGGFRHTGVGNASARNHYAAAGQIQDNALAYAADSGAADAYVIALAPAITAYATGMRITFKATNANTGASTINVNGVGAKNIVWPDGSALGAGAILANGFHTIIYNGTSFELQGDRNSVSSLIIDQNSNAVSLNIDSEATSANIISASASALTTGVAISIIDADALTSGSMARLHSNSSSTVVRSLVEIINADSAAIGTKVLAVEQNAANEAIFVDQNGNGESILIDSEATSANVISVATPATTTGNVISVTDANSLATGRLLYLQSNSASTSTRNLAYIANDNASATSATALSIFQNANCKAVNIDAATTTDNIINVDGADSLTTGRIAYFHSDSSSTSTRDLVMIVNDNASASGTTPLSIRQDANALSFTVTSTNESNTNVLVRADCYRSASSAYNFFLAISDSNGSSDPEFNLSGDGNGTCDGSWTGGGADYAEYFEWADGNPNDDDRRGISVVLDGNKIREATVNDDPLKVIGVISGNPSVVGDAAWNKWTGKHLRDDFGSYIMEDYEVWEWSAEVVEEPAVLGKRGKILKPAKIKEETYSFSFDCVPEGLEVPGDKKVTIQQRRKLNPDWDPNVEYIPREHRPEWDTVGLMGKLRIRKGQMVSPYWIKMRDISEEVEEWLVR